jgi:geranylgeranylglycerol-phosphate geranylgeranyltransferase
MLENLKKYTKFIFPQRLILPVVGLIAGAIITVRGIPNLVDILVACVAIIPVVVSTITINGISDVEIDRINKPRRALPSGNISKKNAWYFAAVLACLGFFVASQISLGFFLLLFLFFLGIFLYSLPPIRLRKYFIVSNVIVSLTYALLPLSWGWILFGDGEFPLIFLAITLISFPMNCLKDVEDYKGDERYGVKTVPVVINVWKFPRVYIGMLAMAFLAVYWAIFSGIIDNFAIYPTTFAAVIGVLLWVLLQRKMPGVISRPADAIVSHSVLLSYSIIFGSIIEFGYAVTYLG